MLFQSAMLKSFSMYKYVCDSFAQPANILKLIRYFGLLQNFLQNTLKDSQSLQIFQFSNFCRK